MKDLILKLLPAALLLWAASSVQAQEQNRFNELTLLFAGDLMQHQAQIDAARQTDGTFDYTACFQYVRKEIGKADIAIGNLEVTLGGEPYRGYPQFSAPDQYAQAIKDAGFDILLTANNHSLDRRKSGLERTILTLDSIGLLHAGTYRTPAERNRNHPLIINRNGIRIALLNYTYGTNGIPTQSPNIVNLIDKELIRQDIQSARANRPDLIIACMHWGIEYRQKPEKQEQELAQWLISEGVDHVIGSHPHVIQPMEIYTEPFMPRQHIIAYSLGNFLSNMSAPNTDGGVMLKMKLRKLGHLVQVVECGYSLVWTSRPQLNQKGSFLLYPAANPPEKISPKERVLLDRFVESSRNLLNSNNIGISEYFFR